MAFEVSVVTRTFEDSNPYVNSYVLVTLDGSPVSTLLQSDFSVFVPATREFTADKWGQPFGFDDGVGGWLEEMSNTPGMAGVYSLRWQTFATNANGDIAWMTGFYMGILEVTHTVHDVIGIAPGSPSSQGMPGKRLKTEPHVYRAKTIFSFNILPAVAEARNVAVGQ
ncbi:hypothetical protein [Paraburkholderia silvatlantica]|uniref:Uncharacterized protein n=1 Tax=Paraburkholderia silvatlantica TaxID=321895 RepID=A0ABR6FKM1_9BURK|nr:hypothetical protein [Paraburkholderia silvatlantica]MBB2927911.1 hypothetical protein [Paraburkholderia silvatlantica]PVY27526.1 hypothetical protein C7411_11979 [Paraburkholderia silvatlantica]PXW34499.1 hypothetical protein C7413_11879 [Paraburkholderia silvatlantica]